MTVAPLPASALAARLVEVAARLDEVALVPVMLQVKQWSVTVQFDNEAEVDHAADLFTDCEAADPSGGNYTRTAFFDDVVTVRIFSGRTIKRCGCGAACTHRAVAS